MKVKEVMTPHPVVCMPEENLATAAMRMWNGDCGILPVVDDGLVRGVVTDRDLCMALAFKGAEPSAVTVGELIDGRSLYSCSPDDELTKALDSMREHQVRRLPVIEDGRLRGLVSMNDVVLAAQSTPGGDSRPTYQEVVIAMQGICAHPVPAAAAA